MSAVSESLIGVRRRLRAVVGRVTRPALEDPESPLQAANARIRALETSVSELWHISERLRGASDRMYAVADDELPSFREEFDGRLMSQDTARVELVHGMEAIRRRVQSLEERLAELEGTVADSPAVEEPLRAVGRQGRSANGS